MDNGEIKTKCIGRPDWAEECFCVERFDDDECRAVRMKNSDFLRTARKRG